MKQFLFGLFLLLALSASAQNQYFVSATGSAANTGLTVGSPWTPTKAISSFALDGTNGAVITFAAGDYGGQQVTINRGGTSIGNKLVVKCAVATNVAAGGGNGCKNLWWLVTVANFVDVGAIGMFGFEYSNANAQVGVDVQWNAGFGNSIHVLGNYLHDIGQNATGSALGCPYSGAILAPTGHGNTITDFVARGNVIDHFGLYPGPACNDAHGIYTSSANGVIEDNIITRAASGAIQVYDQACNTVVSNNVLANSYVGLIFFGANGCTPGLNTISNNAIVNNGTGVTYGSSGNNCSVGPPVRGELFSNNNMFGNGTAFSGTFKSCETRQGTLAENPTTSFMAYTGTAAGDYHLKAGSALIGGGTTQAVAGGQTPTVATTDIAGTLMSSPPPIGAYTFAASGTPISNVSPGSIPFGSATAGVDCSTVTPLTSTFSNAGSGNLTISGETITGANASDFPFGGIGTCFVGQTLTGGQNCTVSAKFCPAVSSTGSRAAQINITSNAAAQTVPLSGTGTPPLVPVLTTPSPLAFGNQNINTTSSTLNYHIANSGTGSLSVTGLVVAGNFATLGTGTCGAVPFSVSAGAFCDQPITFTPLSLGSLSGTVTLTHNAAGSPTVTNLSGTGTQPDATLTSSVSLGSAALNTPTASQPATLTNTGNGPLTVTGVSISAPFSQTNSCGALPFTLAPSGTCVFNVVCTPNVSGPISGQLQTTDHAPSPTQISALSCTGSAPASNGLTIKGGVKITGGVRLLQPGP